MSQYLRVTRLVRRAEVWTAVHRPRHALLLVEESFEYPARFRAVSSR